VKFYVSFEHGTAGYNMPPGYMGNPNPWIRNTFIFTITDEAQKVSNTAEVAQELLIRHLGLIRKY